jgi:hypothetical protein
MPQWDHPGVPADDDDAAVLAKSPEDVADRFGIRAALLVLCVGLFLAGMWLLDSPSFEKCSAAPNVSERVACYDELRKELFKPPAKGGEMPGDRH